MEVEGKAWPGCLQSSSGELHPAAKLWPRRWAGASGAKLSFPTCTRSGFLTLVHACFWGFLLFFLHFLSRAELCLTLFA